MNAPIDIAARLPLTSVDSRPHDVFHRYSDGNFAEVAPDRLSPLAWSVIGPPAERGVRQLYASLVPHLRPHYERPTYTFVGYFGFKPYHNADALFSIVPYTPWFTAEDIARHYLQGMDTAHVRSGRGARAARAAQAKTVMMAVRRLADLRPRYNEGEQAVHEAERMAGSCPRLDAVGVAVLRRALDAAWEAHVDSTSFAALLVAWSERLGHRGLGTAWDRFTDVFLRPDEVVWQSMRFLPGVSSTDFLDAPYYEVGDQDPMWRDRAGELPRPGAMAAAADDGDVPELAEEGLRRMLEQQYSPMSRMAFRAVVEQARWLLSDRERSKALMMRALHAVRRTVLDSGIPKQVEAWSGCTLEELAAGQWDRGGPRLAEFEHVVDVPLPSVLDTSPRARRTPRPSPPAPPIGVSPGVARGPVYHPEDADPPLGGILVCERADSPLLHELTMASGVVCEKGSFLSHVAIICRSLGIPAVVNVDRALTRYRPGQVVRIDGAAAAVDLDG